MACSHLGSLPMFRYLLGNGPAHILRLKTPNNLCPPDGWAVVTANGQIYANPGWRAETGEWVYMLAHCLLHLAFGHFETRPHSREWQAACDYYNARFLADLKLGVAPSHVPEVKEFPAGSEEKLYQIFCERGVPEYAQAFSPAGSHSDSMIYGLPKLDKNGQPVNWPTLFARGLAEAVSEVVEDTAARQAESQGWQIKKKNTLAQRCRTWFINQYPLLASLAASFELIEDSLLCDRLKISIAAVDSELREIYLNPHSGLDEEQMRFVIAHELLHVGLRHEVRRQGREPFLWNIACDYVINGWLVEMSLGQMPSRGALYDPDLKGKSAEAIYDMIIADLRRFRKLGTFRGIELGDLLERRSAEWWNSGSGCELDEFYRRCLSQGLFTHQNESRGLLPADLVEMIKALYQPPIPWDVELAHWFDEHFPPLEERQTYARASRRQSSTPYIPRPNWRLEPLKEARTFGVVLDTSGSMDRNLLAKALGAIASYSLSHQVVAVRVVFCDAAPYDQGHVPPETIAGRVKVRGRGGTILQPAIKLLESAEDFPKTGPLLIITDGQCDRLHIRREHAFLIPAGSYLPFPPTGKVFRFK